FGDANASSLQPRSPRTALRLQPSSAATAHLTKHTQPVTASTYHHRRSAASAAGTSLPSLGATPVINTSSSQLDATLHHIDYHHYHHMHYKEYNDDHHPYTLPDTHQNAAIDSSTSWEGLRILTIKKDLD
ncbi:hypothetical protein HK102_010593, partial [Quaeritorhiza haematococci]